MTLARDECGMENDFLSEATDNLLLWPFYYYFDNCFVLPERSTFGLELEILRSCRGGFFWLHFLLQDVWRLFLSELKMIMGLTTQGEETKPEKQTYFLTRLANNLENSLSYDIAEAKSQGRVRWFKKPSSFFRIRRLFRSIVMDINNKIMQRHKNNHVKEKTPSIAFPNSTKWHLKPGADLAPKTGSTESNTFSPVARKGTERLPW